MVYNSIKSLLKEYPSFLDKRESSNFTKTRKIWNNRMMEVYNDLFQVYLDSKIRKHLLLWKTQEHEYNYAINFDVSIPKLKKITCYKNDEIINTKEYEFEDEVSNFNYVHNDTTNGVASENYVLTTYDVLMRQGTNKKFTLSLVDKNNKPLSNKTVTFNINGTIYRRATDNDGNRSISLNTWDAGEYNIISSYTDDNGETITANNTISILYNEGEETTISVLDGYTLTSKNIVMEKGDNNKFILTLTDADNTPLVDKEILIDIDGNLYRRYTNADGNIIFSLNTWSVGEYNITSSYTDDDGEILSATNKVVILYKPGEEIITARSEDYNLTGTSIVMHEGDNSKFILTLTDADNTPLVDKEILIDIDGRIYRRYTSNNGNIIVNLNTWTPGEVFITSSYTDENENSITLNNTIVILYALGEKTVTTDYHVLTTNDVVMQKGDNNKFTILLTDGNNNPLADKDLTITVNDTVYHRTTDENGKRTIYLNTWDVGEYNITTSYTDDNGETTTAENKVVILYKTSEEITTDTSENYVLSANNIVMYEGENKKFTLILTDKNDDPLANKTVTINVDGTVYRRTTDEDGRRSVSLNTWTPGECNIISSYTDENDETVTSENKVVILYNEGEKNVINDYYTLTTKNIVMEKGDNNKFTLLLTDGYGNPLANKTLTIDIDGTVHHRVTDEEGKRIIYLDTWTPGESTFISSYTDDDGKTVTANNKVVILYKVGEETTTVSSENYVLDAKNIVMHEGDNNKFILTLTDKNGNPLANKTVTINVDGTVYRRTTDEDGRRSVNLNTWTPGELNFISSYTDDNDETVTSENTVIILYAEGEKTTTVTSENYVLTTKDVVMHEGDNNKFILTLTDNNGNPLANKTVTINADGTVYRRTTDEEGKKIIYLDTWTPGECTFISTYNDDNDETITAENKVVILYNQGEESTRFTSSDYILSANSIVMHEGDNNNFTILLTDNDYNPLSDKNIIIDIDGTIYRRTTDEEGKINVNLNKWTPGECNITSSYTTDEDETISINNKVVILYNQGEESKRFTSVDYILSANSIVMHEEDNNKFILTLTDKNGNPLADKTLTIDIGGTVHRRTTDEEGKRVIYLDTWTPGEYNITSSYTDENDEVTTINNKIVIFYNEGEETIVSVLNGCVLTTNNIVMKQGENKKFIITLKDNNYLPLPDKEITIDINGTVHRRTTDEEGKRVIYLDTWDIGEYNITTSYTDDDGETLTAENKVVIISDDYGKIEPIYYEPPIISEDTYYIKVETYDEYTLLKGFPENDVVKGDIFDHDESLDQFGELLNIPRKNYTYGDDTDYSLTEPHYNNRETEDDYHYMNRILYYAEHIQDTPLPLLELWKLFGDNINASMTNREDLLCKMFSKAKHTPDGEKYNDAWIPEEWEHKDIMGCPREDPIYFFASVNDASPVYGRNLKFTFKFYNSLVEPNTDYKYIRVYLNGEEFFYTPKDSSVPTSLITDYEWIISTKSFDESVYNLRFQFRAYKSLQDYNEDVDYLESEEIPVIIKGCGNADFYVNYNTGSDSNNGDRDHPFKTLEHAVSRVETDKNVIVLQAGTHIINSVIEITTDTSILSCSEAVIKSLKSCDIFFIHQDHALDLVNVGLKYRCCTLFAEDEKFINDNRKNEKFRVTIPLTECKIPITISTNNNKPTIHAHTNYTISGYATTLELTGRKTYVEPDSTGKSFDFGENAVIKHLNTMGEKLKQEPIELYDGLVIEADKLKDTTETKNSGKYSFDLRFNKKGTFNYLINHPETNKYCFGDTNVLFTVKDMPTTLTASISEPEILIGDMLPITYTLKDHYDVDVETGDLYLYEDNTLVETVAAYDNFTYIPPLGNHTYKVEFRGDSYVTSVVTGLTCNVRKYHTSMVLLSSQASYKIDDDVIVYGTLIDEINRPISNALIKVYDGDVLLSQSYSREDGTVTFNIGKLNEGHHYLKLTYDGNSIYDNCISNTFRIRIRTGEVADINLYLYPEHKILNADTHNIPCKVYACDRNGNPLKTGFHLWSTYEGEYPTNYTTENDGWCELILNTEAIHNCHGLVLQAISLVDEDVYSNIVFIRDYVNHPLPITDYMIISEKSTYSYADEIINVNGYLIDVEDSPVPLEDITISLYDGNTLITSQTLATDVKGEFHTNLINNGIRLDTLTLKLAYAGNINYTGVNDETDIVFYPPKTTIDSYDSLSVYKDITTINIPVDVIDEYNNNAVDGDITLTLNGNTYNGVIVNGHYTFNNIPVPNAGTYEAKLNYNGNNYYENSQYSFELTVLKLDTSLNNINIPTITYSDEFTITGVLKNTTRNTNIKSKTISLYIDNSVIKTATTNSKGEFTIKHTITDRTGSHSLYLKYDGDNIFKPCQSTTINIDVKHETSVLTLTNPKSTYYIGGNFDLNGTLKTDDGEVIREPVKMYVNNVLKQTITPGTNGAFTFTYLNNLNRGQYTIRIVHDQSSNYTSAEYTYTCNIKEDTLELYASIDSMDGTGIINYGEEFILTITDSEFEETTSHSQIFSNLQFQMYDKNHNPVTVDYEDNIFLDSRVYTIQYLAETFLMPGNYTIEIISPATGTYDYKELIIPITIKDSLKLYAYATSETYSDNIVEGEIFIVTVIDDYFNEGIDLYADVYENLELTVYDSNNNIINVPYEVNTYSDTAIYTMLYGATETLPAGNYKILIVSPATTEHGRKQVTLNITIGE